MVVFLLMVIMGFWSMRFHNDLSSQVDVGGGPRGGGHVEQQLRRYSTREEGIPLISTYVGQTDKGAEEASRKMSPVRDRRHRDTSIHGMPTHPGF